MIPRFSISLQLRGRSIPAEAPRIPLYFHKEDRESGVFGGALRPCAYGGGCPAVFNFIDDPALKVKLTKYWQFFLAGINYNMRPEDVAEEFHYHLAFCNNTGLGGPTPRRDYLREKDLNALENGSPAYPRFDKVRTCSRSVMSGREEGEYLIVDILDGSKPPPLKPGRRQPEEIEEINPDDYLYLPETHRHLFFAANTVSSYLSNSSKIYPFPRGSTYKFMGDGWRYTWFPHVSRIFPVKYPLKRLRRLSQDEPIPSPYRAT